MCRDIYQSKVDSSNSNSYLYLFQPLIDSLLIYPPPLHPLFPPYNIYI